MSNPAYVCVSTANSKLGTAIPNINLPPIVTCRPDAPCFKGCYALKGHFLFPGPKNAMQRNLDHYYENPELYFDTISVLTAGFKFCRWHSAGDIVDSNYFLGMIKVAKKNKDTKYLCFTKKFEIINDYLSSGKKIPKNLSIVFSNWDTFQCDNPYHLPTTWVYAKDFANELIPENSIPCTGECWRCQACWTLKKGGKNNAEQSVFFKKH